MLYPKPAAADVISDCVSGGVSSCSAAAWFTIYCDTRTSAAPVNSPEASLALANSAATTASLPVYLALALLSYPANLAKSPLLVAAADSKSLILPV